MATKIYDTIEVELQDGTVVTVRPLSIKLLRKFMEVMKKMDTKMSEEENLDILVEACGVALERQVPDIAKNRENLEDALDVPTMWKIIEVAGGIKMSDPNLLMEAARESAGLT